MPFEGLGHDAVESCTFELGKPLLSELMVAGRRSHVNRRLRVRHRFFQDAAALFERLMGVVDVVQRKQIKGHKPGRRLLRQQLDAAGRRMDALLQHLELEPIADHDDDLPVDHATLRHALLDRRDDFREVAGHRSLVARADLHLVSVAEHDRSKAIPLRLERE